jgi:sulfhydrogenase subunit alpha
MNSVLEISPLTRLEGHGRITVFFAGRKVEKVTFSLCESPRFFEALLKGKSYEEVPGIICRICSICSSVHRVCALLAIEKALDIQVSEQVRLYRELILCGGHMQSHALHLFCLVLPDFHDTSSLPGLVEKAPEELKMGLRIKAAGNLIQETVGGRLIHPVTLIPGGMGKPVPREGLLKLRETLLGILPETRRAFDLFRSFLPAERANTLGTPLYVSVRTGDDSQFIGDSFITAAGESIAVDSYENLLSEHVTVSSNAKTTLVHGKPPVVGALARINLGMRLSPMAASAMIECRVTLTGADIRANNLAQAVELILTAEHALTIVDTLLDADFAPEKPPAATTRKGHGSAATEAPRGVLLHSYGFDSRGICTSADVITPTAINQAAIERDLLTLALSMDGADDQALTGALEQLVRAYDPCISCAVHIVRL